MNECNKEVNRELIMIQDQFIPVEKEYLSLLNQYEQLILMVDNIKSVSETKIENLNNDLKIKDQKIKELNEEVLHYKELEKKYKSKCCIL